MAREIRISVDDDEVFERMKRRKADLDLTWEDALKRGLQAGNGPDASGGTAQSAPSEGAGPFDDVDPLASGSGSQQGHSGRGAQSGQGSNDPSPIAEFSEQLRQQVQSQVRDSLESSIQSAHNDLDREMRDLRDAEDAVLRFEVLGDEPRYDVPLRVRLETSRDGLDVEVVAVREGKSVTGTNRFDRDARRRVNEHLATGGTATLSFGANGDSESYDVAPVCSWGRTDDGTPRVSAVEVHEVIFDDT